MRQLGEGRAVSGFPQPGVFISAGLPPLALLSDADANASTGVQPTRRDVLLIGVSPEKETHGKRMLSMLIRGGQASHPDRTSPDAGESADKRVMSYKSV